MNRIEDFCFFFSSRKGGLARACRYMDICHIDFLLEDGLAVAIQAGERAGLEMRWHSYLDHDDGGQHHRSQNRNGTNRPPGEGHNGGYNKRR